LQTFREFSMGKRKPLNVTFAAIAVISKMAEGVFVRFGKTGAAFFVVWFMGN